MAFRDAEYHSAIRFCDNLKCDRCGSVSSIYNSKISYQHSLIQAGLRIVEVCGKSCSHRLIFILAGAEEFFKEAFTLFLFVYVGKVDLVVNRRPDRFDKSVL